MTVAAEHYAPPADRATGGRNASIDILRGLAILWVVIYHLWGDVKIGIEAPRVYDQRAWHFLVTGHLVDAATSGVEAVARIGYQGVPLFMMLSGLSLYLSSRGRRPVSALAFYRSRLRRILVPYWTGFGVFMVGVVGVAALQVWQHGGSFSHQYHHGVTLAAFNVIDIGWGDAVAHVALVPRLLNDKWLNTPPGGLWFVALIVQYYLLFPPLKRVLERIGVVTFVAAALAIEVAFKMWIIGQYGKLAAPGALHMDTAWAPARLLEFALGMALGYLLVHKQELVREYTSSALDVAGIVILGAVLQIGGSTLDFGNAYLFALSAPMVIAGLTLMTLPLIARRPRSVELSVPGRALAWAGAIAYTVLIVNEPMRLLQDALRGEVPEAVWWFFLVVVYVPASVLLARPLAVWLGLVPKQPREDHATEQARPPAPAEPVAVEA